MTTFIEKYIAGDDENYVETIDSNDWLAQTFTLGNTGTDITSIISSVDLKISNAASGTLTASIYEVGPDGAPTGSAISTGTAAATIFDSGVTGKWGRVSMSEQTLQPSTQYALVISATNALTSRADGTSPTYAGGSVWYSDDSGGVWTEDNTTDIMFSVNGADADGTFCTIGEALFKAGANANAVAKNPLLVTQFIKMAESKVNVLTIKDWTTAYASLTDEVKYVLNDAASTFAAIYIINYGEADDGFTLESQRKIENLRVLGNELVRELKDVDVQTFVIDDE